MLSRIYSFFFPLSFPLCPQKSNNILQFLQFCLANFSLNRVNQQNRIKKKRKEKKIVKFCIFLNSNHNFNEKKNCINFHFSVWNYIFAIVSSVTQSHVVDHSSVKMAIAVHFIKFTQKRWELSCYGIKKTRKSSKKCWKYETNWHGLMFSL